MSNWKRWPYQLNEWFAATEKPEHIVYPDLGDGSPLVLASDYSGEHADPEFRVLSFLVTTYKALDCWEPLRRQIRNDHMADGRRMSFKSLNDSKRINAFPPFLNAASQLNGVLVCVGVEKGFSFPKENFPPRLHDWSADTLNKLVEICIFGATLIDGLRTNGQHVHWITDDDSIVSTEKAQFDAMNLMRGLLQSYPDERPEIGLGITSKFDDDRRAEDVVAIPDLAAGAFSETLTTMGKENMPTSGSGAGGLAMFSKMKTSLLNGWRSFNNKPLKHMNAVIRNTDDGKMLLSFGSPMVGFVSPNEAPQDAPILNSKWRKSLEIDLKSRGVDPEKLAREMGLIE